MRCKIFQYGNGEKPETTGILMACSDDSGYAATITTALAFKYPNQWFGFSFLAYKTEKIIYSKPLRVITQESL